MRLFKCQACGNILYFEKSDLWPMRASLAYLPEQAILSSVEPTDDNRRTPPVRRINSDFFAQMQRVMPAWLVPRGTNDAFCLACRHNGVIPDLVDPSRLVAWQQIELAQQRLFHTLLRWNLPLRTVAEDPVHGLSFEFLADAAADVGPKVFTGHDEGKITIALQEANDAERERRRLAMGEPQAMQKLQ
jgi:hypothetical protein